MKKVKCNIEKILKYIVKFTKYEKEKKIFNEVNSKERELSRMDKS